MDKKVVRAQRIHHLTWDDDRSETYILILKWYFCRHWYHLSFVFVCLFFFFPHKANALGKQVQEMGWDTSEMATEAFWCQCSDLAQLFCWLLWCCLSSCMNILQMKYMRTALLKVMCSYSLKTSFTPVALHQNSSSRQLHERLNREYL